MRRLPPYSASLQRGGSRPKPGTRRLTLRHPFVNPFSALFEGYETALEKQVLGQYQGLPTASTSVKTDML
jgi:hypothetical protein